MLGGSEFRLRQGFRLGRKHLDGAKAPPALGRFTDSPHTGSAEGVQVIFLHALFFFTLW